MKKLRGELVAAKNENEKLKDEYEKEKENLNKKIEELSAVQTAKETEKSQPPESKDKETVMVKPVVSTAAPAQRTKAQPQAQVQPTRHMPQQPQTATVRPTTTARVVAATRTQNVASVSPSSAATLNPNAAEFSPAATPAPVQGPPALVPIEQPEAVASEAIEAVATPLATVPPRQSEAEPQPSTSSSMTASVAPTLKRSREDEAGDEAAKKARSEEPALEQPRPQSKDNTPDDDVVVLSSSEEEDEPSEEEPPAEDEEDEDITEAEGDDLDEDDEDESAPPVVMEDDEAEEIEEDEEAAGGYEYPMASSADQDDDAVLVVESSDEEVEADTFMATEEIEESSNPLEDAGAVVPQMETVASTESTVTVEVSASVPSGAQVQVQSGGQFEDATEDSVVPSTPKLSSSETGATAQVPSFMFQAAVSEAPAATSSTPTFSSLAASASISPSSSGVKGASQEGIDRTAVDFSQFTGSAQPSTAAPTDFAALAKKGPSTCKILFFQFKIERICLYENSNFLVNLLDQVCLHFYPEK